MSNEVLVLMNEMYKLSKTSKRIRVEPSYTEEELERIYSSCEFDWLT